MPNLPSAPDFYDRRDQAQLRAALEQLDATNFKKGEDVSLFRGERLRVSYAHGLTAHSGGGKASALQLSAAMNHIATSAANGDSVLLPTGLAGMRVSILNMGGHSIQVFGKGTDTVNDVATATGVSQPATTHALYDCPKDGTWYRNLSA